MPRGNKFSSFVSVVFSESVEVIVRERCCFSRIPHVDGIEHSFMSRCGRLPVEAPQLFPGRVTAIVHRTADKFSCSGSSRMSPSFNRLTALKFLQLGATKSKQHLVSVGLTLGRLDFNVRYHVDWVTPFRRIRKLFSVSDIIAVLNRDATIHLQRSAK